MIKVSRLADYAVVVLATMSDSSSKLMAASDVAQAANLPEPTVAKVLKLLLKAGLLSSVRGAGGGYALAKSVGEISISEIITAVDGPIALTACVENSKTSCDYAVSCPVSGRWDQVNDAILRALDEVSLAEMIVKERLGVGAQKAKELYKENNEQYI